ncbi:MAG TPA: HAMP domain-containing protein [Thiolapillus brandeum]|uniref:histidine kinase n=1 Tax=Thiolapillus brandeum TaxID=1076588 RepID=A0A831NTL9_9GAMM|nr:HAMP domain-containing protein [Thiolapillus brandeum]
MRFPNTLFSRTSLTISGALLVFILFTGFMVFNYMLLPIGRQSAEDLAALMTLSAKTWVELPPSARQDFERELKKNHDLILQTSPPDTALKPLLIHSPYMLFLEEAISARLGQTLHVHQSPDKPNWYWVILPVADKTLCMVFDHDRIGAEPPRAALGILFGASLFILLTTLLVVRRITRPLKALSQSVERLGSGAPHQTLSEDGPEELASLARKFNQLSGEIAQLLENRTTLLGGISHDLRTPLSRLRISVELLQGKEDPALLQNMQQDLEEMDAIIGRTLELARMMQGDEIHTESHDLSALLQDFVTSYQQEGRQVALALDTACVVAVNRLILQRILGNLLDNAFHYAGGRDVEIRLRCDGKQAEICILDRGSGIPEEQLNKVLQPFYRLDPSRNRSTGGSGLGLAIVQQLVQLQGWNISVRNRASGGLAVCIEIPSLSRNY